MPWLDCVDKKVDTIETETVLVCVGRMPNTANMGIKELGIEV